MGRINQSQGCAPLLYPTKAKDSLGDVFALKAPLPGLVCDREYISQFINEIQLARKVTHPNVCRIFEFDWHRRKGADDIPFFTMDLLEGETLSRRLKRKGRLSFSHALPIAKQIAEGVNALHARNIFHRDLKPGNVMLTRDEAGELLPVLMDFGLARGLSGAGSGSDTVTSRVMGTLDYMAPEQRAGGRIGKYSDVYSFGLILQNLVSFSSQLSSAEQKLKGLIRACTVHDPQDRPKDGKEICERLGSIEYKPVTGGSTVRTADDDSSIGQTVPLESFSDMETASRPGAGFQTWVGAAVALLVLSVPILWQIPSVKEPLADRLCAVFPGSSMFCLLPQDKDLAILPIEVIADTPENQLIGDGYVRYLSDNLPRLYPNRRDHCVHARPSRKNVYFEELILEGAVVLSMSRIRFQGQLRRSDGRIVRTLEQEAAFEDLPDFAESVVTGVIEMTGQRASEPALTLLRNTGTVDSVRFQSYLQGLALVEAVDGPGKWQPAEEKLKKAQGTGLEFALAAVALGDALREGFRVDGGEALAGRAERYYRQAHSADKLAALHSARGRLDILRGAREAGIERLKEALRLDPYDLPARESLAHALKAVGRRNEGELVFRDGMAAQPQCWQLNNGLARFYLDTGRYEESERQLMRLVELSSNNGAAYTNLALVYLIQGQYDEAVKKGTRAFNLDGNPQSDSTVGQAYLFGGCREDGISRLRRSVETQEPKRYIYWLNLAETLRFLPGHEAEAAYATQDGVREASKRAKADPHDAVALRFLARGQAWLGNRRGALATLGLLEQADPRSIVRYTSAAAVHELFGDRKAARDALKEALKLGVTPSYIRHNPAFLVLARSQELKELVGKAIKEVGETIEEAVKRGVAGSDPVLQDLARVSQRLNEFLEKDIEPLTTSEPCPILPDEATAEKVPRNLAPFE